MIRKTLTAVLVLLFVTAGLVAAAGSPKKTEIESWAKVYNEGVDLMQAGNYAAAQAKFEAALAEKEDFAEAHNNLGYSLRKQGADHREEALEHYNRAIELKPRLAAAYMYRGVLYVLMGDEAKAKADHNTLADLNHYYADQLLQVIATGEEPEGNAGLTGAWQPD